MATTGGKELLNVKELLAKLGVKPGQTIIDFGCGPLGLFTLPAARIVGPRGRVYAVDVLKSALESVENHAKFDHLANVTTVWSNIEVKSATKIPSNSADLELLVNVLYSSDKRFEIFKEIRRLIKPGGKLLVTEWKTTVAALGPKLDLRPEPSDLIGLAKDAGFKELEQFEVGDYHYGLLFQAV